MKPKEKSEPSRKRKPRQVKETPAGKVRVKKSPAKKTILALPERPKRLGTPEEWEYLIDDYRRKVNASYGREDNPPLTSGTPCEPDDLWVKEVFVFMVRDGTAFKLPWKDIISILELHYPTLEAFMQYYRNNFKFRVARAAAEYVTRYPRQMAKKTWASVMGRLGVKRNDPLGKYDSCRETESVEDFDAET